jgi:hypothetical protein
LLSGFERVLINPAGGESAASCNRFVTNWAKFVTKRAKPSFLASQGAVDVRF